MSFSESANSALRRVPSAVAVPASNDADHSATSDSEKVGRVGPEWPMLSPRRRKAYVSADAFGKYPVGTPRKIMMAALQSPRDSEQDLDENLNEFDPENLKSPRKLLEISLKKRIHAVTDELAVALKQCSQLRQTTEDYTIGWQVRLRTAQRKRDKLLNLLQQMSTPENHNNPDFQFANKRAAIVVELTAMEGEIRDLKAEASAKVAAIALDGPVVEGESKRVETLERQLAELTQILHQQHELQMRDTSMSGLLVGPDGQSVRVPNAEWRNEIFRQVVRSPVKSSVRAMTQLSVPESQVVPTATGSRHRDGIKVSCGGRDGTDAIDLQLEQPPQRSDSEYDRRPIATVSRNDHAYDGTRYFKDSESDLSQSKTYTDANDFKFDESKRARDIVMGDQWGFIADSIREQMSLRYRHVKDTQQRGASTERDLQLERPPWLHINDDVQNFNLSDLRDYLRTVGDQEAIRRASKEEREQAIERTIKKSYTECQWDFIAHETKAGQGSSSDNRLCLGQDRGTTHVQSFRPSHNDLAVDKSPSKTRWGHKVGAATIFRSVTGSVSLSRDDPSGTKSERSDDGDNYGTDDHASVGLNLPYSRCLARVDGGRLGGTSELEIRGQRPGNPGDATSGCYLGYSGSLVSEVLTHQYRDDARAHTKSESTHLPTFTETETVLVGDHVQVQSNAGAISPGPQQADVLVAKKEDRIDCESDSHKGDNATTGTVTSTDKPKQSRDHLPAWLQSFV